MNTATVQIQPSAHSGNRGPGWKQYVIKIDTRYQLMASSTALASPAGYFLFEAEVAPDGVIEWCDEHLKTGWLAARRCTVIAIKDRHDAFAFRMRWG